MTARDRLAYARRALALGPDALPDVSSRRVRGLRAALLDLDATRSRAGIRDATAKAASAKRAEADQLAARLLEIGYRGRTILGHLQWVHGQAGRDATLQLLQRHPGRW